MRDPKEEILVKLNDEIHIAPLGVLYVDNFPEFVTGNVIDIDAMNALELKKRFEVKDRLFGFFCNTLTLYSGQEEDEHIAEIKEICGRIAGVDYSIKYLVKHGNIEEALRRMDMFTADMLRLSDKMFSKQR